MSFEKTELSSDQLLITFSGRLDMDSVADLWPKTFASLKQYQPKIITLDLKAVDYCDGAGIALLLAIEKHQTTNQHSCKIINLRPDLQKLLAHIEAQPDKVELEYHSTENLPEHLGHITVDILSDIKNNIEFLGILTAQLFVVLLQPKKLRWHDFWRVMEDTGPKALPIIALIGFLIGLISTFQAAPSFGEFGAQIYIINLVGLGLVREMGPLLTAVLLSGRTASSFAAEIGTMKINQEIDALKTMGLNSVRFLVVPRILATMIITPLLEAFLIIFGLFGCFLVMNSLGYTYDAFLHQLYQSITPRDCLGGLMKVFAFGWVIAGVGCLHGLKTRFGAQAVGGSTTQAVVSSLIMLVVVDGIFAIIYYVLDI